MASGVLIDEKCVDLWGEFQSTKAGFKQKYRVITFMIKSEPIITPTTPGKRAGKTKTQETISPAGEEWQFEMKAGKGAAITDQVIESEEMMDLLVEKLTKGEPAELNRPRYIIFHVAYKLAGEDRMTSKNVMIKWAPEGASIKQKMLIASSYESFRTGLKTFSGAVVQCDETSEVREIPENLANGKLHG